MPLTADTVLVLAGDRVTVMSTRYQATGSSRLTRTIEVEGATITEEVMDCRDTRNGTVYTDGCHKVYVTTPSAKHSRKPGTPRSKTFYGESAWSNAARYAEDARWWFERQAMA